MKFWAKIDSSNTVVNVIVNDTKPDNTYIETFKDGTRAYYAGIGYTWDGTNFIPPKPGKNWTWQNLTWVPPIPYPGDITDDNGNFIRTKLWSDEQEDWV